MKSIKLVDEIQNTELDLLNLFPNQSKVTIGRNSRNDIQIKRNEHTYKISRFHCLICYDDEKVIVADLNTPYGTFINREKLERAEEYTLNDGDELRLGPKYNLQVKIED